MTDSPCLALLMAALEDAVNILTRYPRDSGEFRDARMWLDGECESAPGFSFSELCEAVGLDVDATRLELQRVSAGQRSVSKLARTPAGSRPIGWTKRKRHRRRKVA